MARDRIFYPSIGVFISNGYVPYSSKEFSLSFDGTNDCVSGSNNIGKFTGAFSASIWMKSSHTGGNPRIMAKDNAGGAGGGYRYWLMATNSSNLFFGNPTGSSAGHTRSEFFDNEWHNVVGTNGGNGGDIKLYLDGSLVDTNVGNGFNTAYAGDQPFSLGSAIAGTNVTLNYSGLLDEPALFDSELSQEEVSKLYNNGIYQSSNRGRWNFNEGTGVIAQEPSGGNNPLVLLNGVEWSTDARVSQLPYLKYTGINLVQDSSVSINFERAEVDQIGTDGLVERSLVSAPEINPSFSYLINNQFSNEDKIGLYIGSNKSVMGNYTISTVDQSNLSFAITTDSNFSEVSEATHFTGYDLINVGNAFLTSYQTSASVGGIGTTSVEYQAATMEYSVYGENNPVPSINLISGDKSNANTFTITDTGRDNISFFVPSEITILAEDVQFGQRVSGANIQSFNLSFSIERKKLEGFGSMHAYNRPIVFPIKGQMSIEISADAFNSGSSEDLFISDRDYNFDIRMLKAGEVNRMVYKIHNARLDSNSLNFGGVGSNASVSYAFSFPITRETGLSFVEEAIL